MIWLLKTEPSVYSYDDLERDGDTMWDGVANNAALKNLRQIKSGDTALIYHTDEERAWVGIAEVVRGFYVNPERDDPRLAVCDVAARERVLQPVTLRQIKACPALQDWALVRQSRLSVVPVNETQWNILQAMAKREAGVLLSSR